jgi:hypothetical protein
VVAVLVQVAMAMACRKTFSSLGILVLSLSYRRCKQRAI